jgi:hypothetical protein
MQAYQTRIEDQAWPQRLFDQSEHRKKRIDKCGGLWSVLYVNHIPTGWYNKVHYLQCKVQPGIEETRQEKKRNVWGNVFLKTGCIEDYGCWFVYEAKIIHKTLSLLETFERPLR